MKWNKLLMPNVQVFRRKSGTWTDAAVTDEFSPKAENVDAKGGVFGFSLDVVDDGSFAFVGAPMYANGAGDWFPLSLSGK